MPATISRNLTSCARRLHRLHRSHALRGNDKILERGRPRPRSHVYALGNNRISTFDFLPKQKKNDACRNDQR